MAPEEKIASGSVFVVIVVELVFFFFFNGEIAAYPYSDNDSLWELKKRVDGGDWHLVNI